MFVFFHTDAEKLHISNINTRIFTSLE